METSILLSNKKKDEEEEEKNENKEVNCFLGVLIFVLKTHFSNPKNKLYCLAPEFLVYLVSIFIFYLFFN